MPVIKMKIGRSGDANIGLIGTKFGAAGSNIIPTTSSSIGALPLTRDYMQETERALTSA